MSEQREMINRLIKNIKKSGLEGRGFVLRQDEVLLVLKVLESRSKELTRQHKWYLAHQDEQNAASKERYKAKKKKAILQEVSG